jgi:serine phosphatase RsbU (regulator of sigma subunit)
MIDAATTTVAVIAASEPPPGTDHPAAAVRERILRGWTHGGHAPELLTCALGDSGLTHGVEKALRGATAAVIVAGRGRVFPGLRRLVALLEDRSLGAVLVLPEADPATLAAVEVFDSLVPIAATAPDAALAGALHAILVRQRTVTKVRAEMDMDRLATDAARRQMEQHQHETALAVMVQRTILPKGTPKVEGLDMGVIYRPGSALSGDIYDVVQLDEHHAGFFVADACGHGVAAALLTMIISRLLPMKEVSGRSYRLVPPGEALTRFNAEFVRRRGELSTLITAVYGVIDTRTGHVTVAGAGHPPVVLTGPTGLEEIENNGPPAGVYEEFDYPQATFHMAPDQTLLAYTDGFEVAFGSERQPDGRQRMATRRYIEGFRQVGIDRQTPGVSVESAVANLGTLLDRQDGSLHQIDDITLLAIARRAPAPADTADAPPGPPPGARAA